MSPNDVGSEQSGPVPVDVKQIKPEHLPQRQAGEPD
jgi:hypothetical protein